MRSLAAVSASAQLMRSCRCSDTSSRRPTKRIRTPSSFSSGVSEMISSANIAINPSTSSLGRAQFSVENAYTVSSVTPSFTASLTVCFSVLAPCRWPARTGSPRASAQRPFPSMMIATFTTSVASDFEKFLLFALEQFVDLVDALVGELLERFLGAVLVVAADVALLLELAQVVHDVAAYVAHGHATVLGDAADDSHHVLAPLLGELRDLQPDHRAVVRGRQAEVGLHDRLLDRLDRRLVVGRHRQQARLGCRDVRQLLERGRGPVVVDVDAIEQRRRSAARAHRAELRLRGVDGLGHPALGVLEKFVDQFAAHVETSVPTRSPETIRWIFASSSMLKT